MEKGFYMTSYILDVNKRDVQFCIEGLQTGDNGLRVFEFSFSERGKPFPLPDGCIATLFARLPGGSTIYDLCTVDGDSVIYELCGGTDAPSLTSESGRVNCEIRITDSEGKVITSPSFSVIVDGVLQDDDAIEATESFSALTKTLSEVQEIKAGYEEAIEDVAAAVESANRATENAEAALSTAEGSLSKADEALDNANEAIEKANDALENTETGLMSKLDKVEGEVGNAAVIGEGGNLIDAGYKPSKEYLIKYYDSATITDAQKGELREIITAIIGDSSNFGIVMNVYGSLLPASLVRIGGRYNRIIATEYGEVSKIYTISLSNSGAITTSEEGLYVGTYTETFGSSLRAPTAHAVAQFVVDYVSEHGGNVSDADIAAAVENYLKENPIEGVNGATFTPSVSADGTLSWSNDQGLNNPVSVNIKGPAGADGAKGDKGETGPAGEDGKDGTDGKSAYEYAKDGGYTGTEAEFIAKMAEEYATSEEVSKIKSDVDDLKASGILVVQDGSTLIIKGTEVE